MQPSGESSEERRHREWTEHQARGRRATRWQRLRRGFRNTCDGCDGCSPGCDCNFPLLGLVRLSTLLMIVAAVMPDRPGTRVALATIGAYQRWLTRFTPACPTTPNCSAYAAEVVRRHGARRGLRAAAVRIAACSRPCPEHGR